MDITMANPAITQGVSMIELINSISWRQPFWLLVSLQPLCLHLLFLLARSIHRENYAAPHLLAWSKITGRNKSSKHIYKSLFNLLAWTSFAICMAGPRIAEKVISTDPSTFTNIMVVLDVSRSMNAHDIYPTRLERAKLELYDFVEHTQYSRIGIILYAGRPHLLSPLTTDKNLLRHYISTIDSSLLPTRGSNLKEALAYASRHLGKNKQQAILLISDGESAADSFNQYIKLLSRIKKQDIHIYSLVTGTETATPLMSRDSGWLIFKNQDVVSKADTDLLRSIAKFTNGKYSAVDNADQEWQKLYTNGMANLNPRKLSGHKSTELIIWKEWFPWFLLFALFFFILAYLEPTIIIHRSLFSLAIVSGAITSGFFINNSYASDNYQQAFQLYRHGEFEKAEKHFSTIDTFTGRLGQASSAYQAEHYSKAATLFIQATLAAQTDQQRIHALFNLANSYYQLENYQAAANIYQDVLRYKPDFHPAITNLAYAQALIKKYKQEQSETTVSRTGKGPRMAKPAADMDLSGGRLMLGDETDTLPYELSRRQDLSTVQPASDLSSAGLVTQEIETGDDTTWTYQFRSTQDMAAIMASTSSNEREFWQRLFEWEEGFPAPLAEPEDIPGINPW